MCSINALCQIKRPPMVTIHVKNIGDWMSNREYDITFYVLTSSTGHSFMIAGWAPDKVMLHDPDCKKCIRRQRKTFEDLLNKKK